MQPHSKAWYQHLGQTQGSYAYPWQQRLETPGGEQLFEQLLLGLGSGELEVLEAGCGHGLDAQRFSKHFKAWVGYDFIPEFLNTAQQNNPGLEFVQWHSGQEAPPAQLHRRFDLVISRRGPTSIILHLHTVCRPGAKVLCIHPWDDAAVQTVRQRCAAVGVQPSGEWFCAVQAWLPSLQDLTAYRRFEGNTASAAELEADWNQHRQPQGYPIQERRYVWYAQLGG